MHVIIDQSGINRTIFVEMASNNSSASLEATRTETNSLASGAHSTARQVPEQCLRAPFVYSNLVLALPRRIPPPSLPHFPLAIERASFVQPFSTKGVTIHKSVHPSSTVGNIKKKRKKRKKKKKKGGSLRFEPYLDRPFWGQSFSTFHQFSHATPTPAHHHLANHRRLPHRWAGICMIAHDGRS